MEFIIYTYSAVLLMAVYSQNNLFLEVVISFLPYWIVINIMLIIILFFLQIRKRAFILLLLITFLYAFKLLSFTLSYPTALGNYQNKQEIKIAFLNKLYSNTNYSEINNKINEIEPDMMGFAEIEKKDINNLPFDKYPFNYIKHIRNGMYLAFFSKYECFTVNNSSNLTNVLPLKAIINDKEYRIYIIHAPSPFDKQSLIERNNNLQAFNQSIKSSSEDIIILGDFNITPWSKTYQSINLNTVKNASFRQGLFFTWNKSVFNAQIDHIFVPHYSYITNFKVENINSSDHDLIWTKIKI